MKRTLFCATKKHKDDDAVRTELTVDMSGLTPEDIAEYALDGMVIKWQASARRKKEPIPRKATYIVPKPGTRATPSLTPLQMLEQLFGHDKVVELVNKAGGNVDAVIATFKSMIE